jgi:hypothetical protein
VSGDVTGLIGKQPDDRVSDLFGLASPPHRDKGGGVRVVFES